MMRGNKHKLECGKFQVLIRKQLFTVRVVKEWMRLPRKVVKSPSLELFKTGHNHGQPSNYAEFHLVLLAFSKYKVGIIHLILFIPF